MMRRNTAILVALLFFFTLFVHTARADDAADAQTLGTFFDDRLNDATTQGEAFWRAGNSLKNLPAGTFVSVYQAFMPASCEPDLGGGGDNVFISAVSLWMEPALIMALIIALGLGAIYMVGQALSSPTLIQMAKDEGFQTFLTVVRVVFLGAGLLAGQTFYSLQSAGSADPIYSNSENKFMIDSAMAFARMMLSDMSTHYSMLVLYNMVLHTIYSSTMWFGVTWRAMYSFNLGPVLRPLIDVVGTSLQFLSLGMSEWLLHIVTLCLIKKWVYVLFIPIAMLLRSFPYTRPAGEALFALAFALALFYPIMFLFDYEVHKVMKNTITDAKGAMSSFIHKSGILNVFGAVLIVMFLMAGVFVLFFLGGALSLALELVRGSVYYIVIMSVLLPALNIFVTLTAAKETARFFNVDVNFLSFLKVI